MSAVVFDDVDIVFGDKQAEALAMIDRGATRDEILKTTGVVLGAAGVNLSIEPSEICVLMGLSGSGKSTILRAVNGLNKVARGKVLVRNGDGAIDVAHCSADELRMLRTSRIAMVFQQFALLPWRTVKENVAFGLELRRMPKDADRPHRRRQARHGRLDRSGPASSATSCPAACSSASVSRAPSPPTPTFFSWTSRSRRSIP